MGHAVEEVALSRSHSVVPIDEAAICIDFSHPDAAIKNLIDAAKRRKNVVMGTTGWYGRMDEARRIVDESGIGFIWAANFSVGVWLFSKLVHEAGKLLGNAGYAVSIAETHHEQKVDSPSGTAKVLRKILEDSCAFPDESMIPIESVRTGNNPGNHTIIFDSEGDTITLAHQAFSRRAFALGAVMAAEWLQGKRGFFTIDDMMKELV